MNLTLPNPSYSLPDPSQLRPELPVFRENSRLASHPVLTSGFAPDGELTAALKNWLVSFNVGKPVDSRLRNRPLDLYRTLLKVYLGSHLCQTPLNPDRMVLAYAFLDTRTESTRTPSRWLEKLQHRRLIKPYWKWETVGEEACLVVPLIVPQPFLRQPVFGKILSPDTGPNHPDLANQKLSEVKPSEVYARAS